STVRLALVGTATGPIGSRGQTTDESLFDGVDTSLAPGLVRYRMLIDSARAMLGPRSLPRVLPLLTRALAELRRNGPADFRAAKEPQLQEALASAAGIVVDPAADDGFIIPGQTLAV